MNTEGSEGLSQLRLQKTNENTVYKAVKGGFWCSERQTEERPKCRANVEIGTATPNAAKPSVPAEDLRLSELQKDSVVDISSWDQKLSTVAPTSRWTRESEPRQF